MSDKRDCEHGQLARSCDCCADAAEIARLRARVLELEVVHEDASGAVLAERERWKPVLCALLGAKWATPEYEEAARKAAALL